MGNKKELVIHRKELTIISSVSLIRNERGDFLLLTIFFVFNGEETSLWDWG